MATRQDNYTLQVGNKGKERLDILNTIYNPPSQAFLKEAGLVSGMHVLEIGAGTGEMACWLAQQVGANGSVTIADNSEEQLAIAQENTEKAGLTNVDFINVAVNDLPTLKRHFDLIYSRWLLMHLQHPQDALRAMYDSLKEGGILVCEDGANTGCFAYPESPTFNMWLEAWRKRFIYFNKDYDSGLKLYSYMQQLGCSGLKVHLFQPLLSNAAEKKVLLLNVEESKNAIISCGYLTEHEYALYIEQLKLLVNNASVIGYLRNMQVAGRK